MSFLVALPPPPFSQCNPLPFLPFQWPLHQVRCARAWYGCHLQRHRRPRRPHPLLCYVPQLHGLCVWCQSPERPVKVRCALRVHPRQHRATKTRKAWRELSHFSRIARGRKRRCNSRLRPKPFIVGRRPIGHGSSSHSTYCILQRFLDLYKLGEIKLAAHQTAPIGLGDGPTPAEAWSNPLGENPIAQSMPLGTRINTTTPCPRPCRETCAAATTSAACSPR